MINPELLWIPPESDILLKSYGQETLLYQVASGDTLLLNPTAVPLIQLLQTAAMDKQQVFAAVADQLNFEPDEGFLAHMESVLAELIKREIVVAR